MSVTKQSTGIGTVPRHVDRGLLLLIAAIAVLIIVGLISVPLLARRTPTLAPADTPQGTVQRFFQAAYDGQYEQAYALLSAETQQRLTLAELQTQISGDLRDSQIRVTDTRITDQRATVEVRVTHMQPGGIFGTGEWSTNEQMLLQREAGGWRIVSGPWYLVAPVR